MKKGAQLLPQGGGEPASLWSIFLAFAKIGAFTIGGGYMMVPSIEAEIKSRGWIPEEELPDMVALSQSAPGLLTVNMAVFTGYKMKGIKGSIAATLGCIIPPIIAILIIAVFFSRFKDNRVIAAMFCGVRPAAVAIIAGYTVSLVRRNGLKLWKCAITLATVICVCLLKISPIYILSGIIVASAAISFFKNRPGCGHQEL